MMQSGAGLLRLMVLFKTQQTTLDLQRVQYISPLEKGSYKVTLVSTTNR